VPAPSDERALWLTLRGARATVPLAWLAWVAAAAVGAALASDALGPAGTVIAVLAIGWLLARRAAEPLEWLRRYHLDDAEVTALGPGGWVRRLPWDAVERLTQERHVLRLEGRGLRLGVPLREALRTGAWGAALARVAPAVAAELWALLDDGEEVRLVPRSDPSARILAWWAYAPAAACCALGAGSAGAALALALAVGERAVAWLRARAGTVTLHRRGMTLRTGLRVLVVPWARAEVSCAPYGLYVGLAEDGWGRIATSLPNFWAVAAVAEMKALLAPPAGADVRFRVRVAEGRLAVVGEVEPVA